MIIKYVNPFKVYRSSPIWFKVFLLFWLSFFLNGFLDKKILQGVGLPFWLVAFPIAFLIVILNTPKLRFRITVTEILIFLIFVCSIPAALATENYYALIVVCPLLSVFLLAIVHDRTPINEQQQQIVFDLGIVIAGLSIVIFLFYVIVVQPRFGSHPVRPGIGYAIDRGVLLRLVGFADDPNFYCAGGLLPLLLGIVNGQLKRRKIGLILIAFSLVLTFSRSGILICVFSILLLTFNGQRKTFFLTIFMSVFASVFYLILNSNLASFAASNTIDIDRSFSTGLESRFALSSGLSRHLDLELFGNTIGTGKEIVGIHSHNSYIDYLYEPGLIASIFFFTYVLVVTFSVLRTGLTVYYVYSLSIFLFSLTVSLPFNPMLLLVPALISTITANKQRSGLAS